MKRAGLFSIAIAATLPAYAADPVPTPRCAEARECEVMWSAAQDAVPLVSNMRNRIVTDSRVETYPPTTFGRVGAIVRKVPAGPAGYEFTVSIECYRSTPCAELQAMGTALFNQYVTAAALAAKPIDASPGAASAAERRQTMPAQ